MPRVLLTEDDSAIVSALTEYLAGEGWETASAPGERAAGKLLQEQSFDLALIDLALQDGSGFGVCALARQRGIPVIFLTASADENSVVAGLDMGADDYISKPFRPRELVSRMRSVLRRHGRNAAVDLPCNVRLDPERGTVSKGGQEVPLSALEFRLLSALVSRRGTLRTRNQLLEELWDIDSDFVNDNTLTVYIKRLREKLEDDPRNPAIIKTVRGLGYRVD